MALDIMLFDNSPKNLQVMHRERQILLKKNDRRKSQSHAYKTPWKESKGYGSRSGRTNYLARNYGGHDLTMQRQQFLDANELRGLDNPSALVEEVLALGRSSDPEDLVSSPELSFCVQNDEGPVGRPDSKIDLLAMATFRPPNQRQLLGFDLVRRPASVIAVSESDAHSERGNINDEWDEWGTFTVASDVDSVSMINDSDIDPNEFEGFLNESDYGDSLRDEWVNWDLLNYGHFEDADVVSGAHDRVEERLTYAEVVQLFA